MKRKIYLLLSLSVLAAIVLLACSPARTQAPAVTEASATELPTEAPTEAPVATEAPTEAPLPPLAKTAGCSYPISDTEEVVYTVDVYSTVEFGNSFCWEPTEDRPWSPLALQIGDDQMFVGMEYTGDFVVPFTCYADLPEGWTTSECTMSGAAVEGGPVGGTFSITMTDITVNMTAEVRTIEMPSNCQFVNYATSFGTFEQVTVWHGNTVYLALDSKTIGWFACNNGEMDWGTMNLTDLGNGDMVNFASGNQCTATYNSEGLIWLDLVKSGEKQAFSDRRTFSACEWLTAGQVP